VADAALADLCSFLDGSPSPVHVVATVAARLQAAGFAEVDDRGWTDVPSSGFVRRDGAVVAWRLPDGLPRSLRLVGAHTDSPGFRVKPAPDLAVAGWRQLGVEVYGGVLPNSWLDRDLGVAGYLVDGDGRAHLVDVRRPVARIPQLAIHLDRAVTEGLVLDRQQHLTPVWAVGASHGSSFREWISAEAGVEAHWWELGLYDVQPAAVLGADRSLLASGRLDNQVSCWAAVSALVEAALDRSDPTTGAVVVLNDHEEVGSDSTTGAGGPFLERVLERIVTGRGGGRTDLLDLLAASACVSADNAHAIHPNYTDRHDPAHAPMVNRGPAVKLNSNQRYATSPTVAGSFERACRSAGVPWQVFVSRNNVPCGSTIGPITATRLGIATVDVGVPQLSMHSARELCGVDDPVWLRSALVHWLAG
jgi:aspartyl aminopeptidase